MTDPIEAAAIAKFNTEAHRRFESGESGAVRTWVEITESARDSCRRSVSDVLDAICPPGEIVVVDRRDGTRVRPMILPMENEERA